MKITLISLVEEINPLGVLQIATYLKTHGHDVTVLFLPLNPKEKEFLNEENIDIGDQERDAVVRFISEMKPELIGMSLMTIHYFSAAKLTQKIKCAFPEIPVIWGGIHPTVLPDECIEHADIVCRGEGEEAMLELVKRLEQREPIEHIESLWVKTKRGINRNEIRPLAQDLNALDFSRFDWKKNYVLVNDKIQLLTKELYAKCVPRKGQIYDIMTTRGCPYNCSYCCNSTFKRLYAKKGKIVRSRSIENVIKEIEYAISTFGFVRIINFQDDVFLARKKDGWLQGFCQEYREKIGLPFACKGSPSEVTDKTIAMLKGAGMEYFQIGIQSSDKVNREIYKRKTSSRNQVIKASGILHKFKILANYDVILDDPFTTEDDILEVLDTLMKIKKPFLISCFSMTFFPGSEIHEMAKEVGLLSKGKVGYRRKATNAKRNYLNNLVEISPRVPGFMIRFFLKSRGKWYSESLLQAYIFIHFRFFFRTIYLISKHPRLLATAKRLRFQLSSIRE